MGLRHRNGSPNLGQKTRPYNNQQKKRTGKIVDISVPADHRIKLKEWEKKDKYVDLARELKNLWNMKVAIIPIVIGAFGTVTKGLLKGLEDLEIRGRAETIHQNTEKSPGDLRRLAVTQTPVKNSQGVNNNNYNNNNNNNTFTHFIFLWYTLEFTGVSLVGNIVLRIDYYFYHYKFIVWRILGLKINFEKKNSVIIYGLSCQTKCGLNKNRYKQINFHLMFEQ